MRLWDGVGGEGAYVPVPQGSSRQKQVPTGPHTAPPSTVTGDASSGTSTGCQASPEAPNPGLLSLLDPIGDISSEAAPRALGDLGRRPLWTPAGSLTPSARCCEAPARQYVLLFLLRVSLVVLLSLGSSYPSSQTQSWCHLLQEALRELITLL